MIIKYNNTPKFYLSMNYLTIISALKMEYAIRRMEPWNEQILKLIKKRSLSKRIDVYTELFKGSKKDL